MQTIAKIFTNGRSQAVRLPAAFRFDVPQVYVRLDPSTGDVILSRRPPDWSGFIEAVQGVHEADFLSPAERRQGDEAPDRDPLRGLD